MAQSITSDISSTESITNRLQSFAPLTYALLRIGAGLLFIQHGAQKLFGVFGGTKADLISMFGFAGVVEFFGGILIVLGLITRPIAALSAVLMVAAYFVGHASHGAVPIMNGGELALLYALLFAAIAANGPGRWSFDAKWLPRLS